MKKLSAVLLAVVLVLSLAACRMRNDTPETTPTVVTTLPTTAPETAPVQTEPMPTLETNIPDPNVDNSMPGMNNGTDGTENSGNGSGNNSDSGSGNSDEGAIGNQNPETGADSRMGRGRK